MFGRHGIFTFSRTVGTFDLMDETATFTTVASTTDGSSVSRGRHSWSIDDDDCLVGLVVASNQLPEEKRLRVGLPVLEVADSGDGKAFPRVMNK